MWPPILCEALLYSPTVTTCSFTVTTGAYMQFLPSIVYLEHVQIQVHLPLPKSLTEIPDSPVFVPSCFQNLTFAMCNQTIVLQMAEHRLLQDLHEVPSPHHSVRRGFMSIHKAAQFLRPIVDKALDVLTDDDVRTQIKEHHTEPILSVPVSLPAADSTLQPINSVRRLIDSNALLDSVTESHSKFLMMNPIPDLGERLHSLHTAVSEANNLFAVYLD